MALDFGPKLIDFSPLGKLGETYDASVKRSREAAMNEARQRALAGFGQNSDLAALGQTLLQAGDLEGGMTALRLDAANKGTPWQREQAAREEARSGATLSESKRRTDLDEEYRKRQEERANNPRYEREVDVDGAGNPIPGLVYPDGRVKPLRPGGTGTGPQSGGPDDPNLPQSNAGTAQLALSPQTSTDPGYVIPKTLQQFPPGTSLPPAALAQLQPPPTGGAAVAAPAMAQAAPLAPPAATGGAAVAAPLPPVAAVPNASTVQPRLNREDPLEPPTVPFVRKPPPNVNIKGWVAAEVKRVAEVTGLGGPGGSEATAAMKAKLADARRTAETLVPELDSLLDDVKEHGAELMPGPVKARMSAKTTNIVMMLKDMYALGALQQGDIQQIERLITNPAADNPVDYMIKGYAQKEVTEAQVKEIKNLVKTRLDAAERNLGGDPTRVPGGGPGGPAPPPAPAGPAARAPGKLTTSTGFNASWD